MDSGKSSIVVAVLLLLSLAACTAAEASPTLTATGSPSSPTPSASGEEGAANADVTFVRAVQKEAGSWTFHVTVRHPDTGWEDYADGWDVVLPSGEVVKPDAGSDFTRTLLHPHVDEQPFTRSQSNIEIPEGVDEVRVRAHDLVDGWGGQEVVVDLTQEAGEDYEVER
ncbi:MAG: hypothetical protein ACLFU8_06500 [Anaerolineales bacterium]